MAYLVNLGVQSSRLSAQGFGESNPIANNKTEAGRAENRRIELIVKGTK
jgi:OOP family OmpA-OmpF porin